VRALEEIGFFGVKLKFDSLYDYVSNCVELLFRFDEAYLNKADAA
jgi:hypothetical protein